MGQRLVPSDQFNAACRAAGLDWDVDGTVCRSDNQGKSERELVQAYILACHAHLLSCYELDFLVDFVLRKAASPRADYVAVESYSPL